MRKQKGLTMSGFITWAVIFMIVALLGFKLGPAYMEEQTIKKIFRQIASDPGMASGDRGLIGRSFELRTAVDNVTSIGRNDIEVTKDGSDIVLSASYTTRIPLLLNISACLDFSPSSK
jgi:hypothetical protein